MRIFQSLVLVLDPVRYKIRVASYRVGLKPNQKVVVTTMMFVPLLQDSELVL